MSRVRTGFGAGMIAGLALLGFAGAPAHALTFTFTSDHCSGTGGCLDGGTGGTVTVTETATNTLHFVISPAAGFGILATGAGGGASFGFNLDADPTITFSNLTSGFDVAGGTNPTGAQTFHMDGAGDFEYGVVCTTACGSGGSSPFTGTLSFDITDTLTLASLQTNADGNLFAMDVLSPNGNTGIIDASTSLPPIKAPEPASLAMLGGALLGFGLLRRRKRA